MQSVLTSFKFIDCQSNKMKKNKKSVKKKSIADKKFLPEKLDKLTSKLKPSDHGFCGNHFSITCDQIDVEEATKAILCPNAVAE